MEIIKCKMCNIFPVVSKGDFASFAIIYCYKCKESTEEYWHHENNCDSSEALNKAISEWNYLNNCHIMHKNADKMISYVEEFCKPTLRKFSVCHPDDVPYMITELEEKILDLAHKFNLD